jgi:hypothetical protein
MPTDPISRKHFINPFISNTNIVVIQIAEAEP